jgi:hypothetical protein
MVGTPLQNLGPSLPKHSHELKRTKQTLFLPFHYQNGGNNNTMVKKKKARDFCAIFLATNSWIMIEDEVLKWTTTFGVKFFYYWGIFSMF